MVLNLHTNSVLPHHSYQSSRSSRVRKTEHRPNNLVENSPENHISASSGTRWTSGKDAPREWWFQGKEQKGQSPGGQERAVGKGPSLGCERGLPLLLTETRSGCGNTSRGEGKRLAQRSRQWWETQGGSSWCGAGRGALLCSESPEGARILHHHYHFQEHGHLQL